MDVVAIAQCSYTEYAKRFPWKYLVLLIRWIIYRRNIEHVNLRHRITIRLNSGSHVCGVRECSSFHVGQNGDGVHYGAFPCAGPCPALRCIY